MTSRLCIVSNALRFSNNNTSACLLFGHMKPGIYRKRKKRDRFVPVCPVAHWMNGRSVANKKQEVVYH